MRKTNANSSIWLSLFTAIYVATVAAYLLLIGKGFDPYDLDSPEQGLGYAKSSLHALYAAGFLPWVLFGLNQVFEKPVSNRAWLALSFVGFGTTVGMAYSIMRL